MTISVEKRGEGVKVIPSQSSLIDQHLPVRKVKKRGKSSERRIQEFVRVAALLVATGRRRGEWGWRGVGVDAKWTGLPSSQKIRNDKIFAVPRG